VGKWTADEDIKLKDAVQMHGGKNWGAIAALVTGRTGRQCSARWRQGTLDTNTDPTPARASKWTADEDSKLKDAVKTHGCKNWASIAMLVPGRSRSQCHTRWHGTLDPSIDQVTGRTSKWSEDEDKNLKDAVETHGGKNWGTIAALVPGRTKIQCSSRWCNILAINIDPMKARAGKWTADENIKLKDAVQTHGGKDWAAIAALVPGRTKMQCRDRWKGALDSNIDPTTARAGKWSEDEDKKLKDSVKTHGGKDWAAIAALVLGRTKSQCYNRWADVKWMHG
jgi:myb proto-oncogene protein